MKFFKQAAASVMQSDARRKDIIKNLVIYGLVVLVIFAINRLSNGVFLTPGNITNVVRQIAVNVVLAAAMTFVIITAGIDLSVGSIIALTGVAMAIFANAAPFHGVVLFASTLLCGLLVGGACGLVNALPVVKFNLPPFITTLAMMQIAKGIAFIISRGQPVPVKSDVFESTGIGYILTGPLSHLGLPGIPIVVLWMVAVLALSSFLLRRTRFGRYVYAVGGNEEAARLSGVSVTFTKVAVYVISGCFAALAGFLLMTRFQSGSPQTGDHAELEAIAAVVVGGTSLMGGRGKILGTFIGALLIGVLNNAMNLLSIESYTQMVVLGAVIVLAVITEELRKRFLARR